MAMVEDTKGASTSGNADDVDERTVFVRSLPYTVTDAQLEDYFSEVGPVRNCFTVKQKGSEQHRGFGFVNFAVKEDAIRSVELKNGAVLQGRKIKVELAKRRAPLDTRHPKGKRKGDDVADGSGVEGGGAEEDATAAAEPKDKEAKRRKVADSENVQPNVELSQGAVAKRKINDGPAGKGLPKETNKRSREEGKASEIQRAARTVVIGCLENPKMVKAAIEKAKKLGAVEDVHHPVAEAELIRRGLAKDGCRQEAVEVVYTSVKVACQAVASLHRQNVGGGGAIWARQLGGEGAKLKKWRLIVRNLPFMLKEQTLRQLFTPSGFVWEITIPRKPDNSSKGFAFVGFTCKADAEKAIKAVNGTLVGKRPIAVDWAVAKNEFETAAAKTSSLEGIQDGDDETASEDESDEGSDDEEEDDFESESDEDTNHTAKATRKAKVDAKAELDMESSDESDGSDNDEEDEDDSSEEKADTYLKEKDLANRVLQKVMAFSKALEHDEAQPNKTSDIEAKQTVKATKTIKTTATVKEVKKSEKEVKKSEKEVKKSEVMEPARKNKTVEPVAETSQKDGLKRTVFVRNLPLEAKVQDLRRQFSDFGEVKSFRLVLHPITKRPKGTAFVEFVTAEGAQEAVNVANKSETDGGLLVGGRKITLNLALDRDQAKQVATQMSKEQDDHDRRHLKLAKEGLIEEGTPAAQGLSKGDLSKRKQIEHEKATKLRSPNFHVSTTRLAVHNVPKDMTEKELKKLFIQAVKSRASKQEPVVKQVKILRDEVKGVPGSGGKSRGAAFVEFTEQQHALVALRVLNNNPETFGSEHRPIIQFAIENSQKLKLRATREALAKGRQARTAAQGDGPNKKAKLEPKTKFEPKAKLESKANDQASEKGTASAGRSGKRFHRKPKR
ncbi:hypothetical protein KC19_8G051800 [Ceratodon purpureus]|uniref:RRM domain-containing protein n=1 Tax=Ceratodon purpureus TaxID=3225 RepID=A0A8T0GVB6_CERPU|nr:hypothetical protein KC19_8G051800 [Ceratodon purpureus]